VGDPFKDTSGPSMNILIKLMSIVSLVIAPTIAKIHADKIQANRAAQLVILNRMSGNGGPTIFESKVISTVDSTGVTNTVTTTVKGTVNADGDFVYDLGAMGKLKLADGTELNVGGNSAEKKLVDFINDATKAVDKTTWFTMDRLYFESGKSVLKANSQEQLKNIAAILKANPAVELKLGGYTDNTGDSTGNVTLSQQRAETAKAELVKLGVEANRLTAEGYGPQYPVADNSSEAGKAHNRRIDVRVSKK